MDNPERYAEIFNGDSITTAEETQYAYKAKLMNDVHMSHAMEFPYPQSMANCATCHEGQLDQILTDDFYVAETCKSCHPVTGPAKETDSHKAPALETLWSNANVQSFHNINLECNGCHYAGNSVGAETFSQKHTGYNTMIYADSNGTKYSDIFSVSIDSASIADNILTINFSATKTGDVSSL